jgi:bacillithiol system protein YtxJ
MINWSLLTQENQIQDIIEESKQKPVVIFKHSTSCSISATAKGRLERQWSEPDLQAVKPYYLDLLAYRPVSNQVARAFEIAHESPQLLLIRNGQCVYDASHLGIRLEEVKKHLV